MKKISHNVILCKVIKLVGSCSSVTSDEHYGKKSYCLYFNPVRKCENMTFTTRNSDPLLARGSQPPFINLFFPCVAQQRRI